MIVLRVLQFVIILLSVFFFGLALYTRFSGTGTEEEKSGFFLYLILFIAGLIMSLVLRLIVRFADKHLRD